MLVLTVLCSFNRIDWITAEVFQTPSPTHRHKKEDSAMLTSSGIMMHVNYSGVHECLEVLTSFVLTEPFSLRFFSLSAIHVRSFAWVTTASSPVEGKQFVMWVNIVRKFAPFWLIEIMEALLSHGPKLTWATPSETLSSANESIWCCQQNESIPPPWHPSPKPSVPRGALFSFYPFLYSCSCSSSGRLSLIHANLINT